MLAEGFCCYDIFSALDPKTKGKIIARLLGVDGLLRKTKSTIILVIYESRTPSKVFLTSIMS
jgi:hypothetical protein